MFGQKNMRSYGAVVNIDIPGKSKGTFGVIAIIEPYPVWLHEPDHRTGIFANT